MRGLVDLRLKSHLPNHWPSLCTIQQVVYTPTASNQQKRTGATPIFVRVLCRMSPVSKTRPSDNEQRTETIQASIEQRIVKLNGYYPSIKVRDMEVVVDGVTYPIRGVEHDSEHFSTRLLVEVVKP